MIGGDIRAFESADRLAAYTHPVLAARESYQWVANNKGRRDGHRTFKRVFYDCKRAESNTVPGY